MCFFCKTFLQKTHCTPTRVNELIAGAKPVNCQIFGDPKSLELSLHDLHPASWSVISSLLISVRAIIMLLWLYVDV
jgi:hypothetical protein